MPIKPTERMRKTRTRYYRALHDQAPDHYASAARAADAIGHNWDLPLAARADVEWHIVSAVCAALDVVPAPEQTEPA